MRLAVILYQPSRKADCHAMFMIRKICLVDAIDKKIFG